MNEFMEIKTDEINEMLRYMKVVIPAKMPAVIASYDNNLAFEAKKELNKEMDRSYQYRSSATRKLVERGVYVEKASARVQPIASQVGVLAPAGARGQFMGRSILARQFGGGDVEQYNGSSLEQRGTLMVDVRAGKKSPIQVAGKVAVGGGKSDKQRMAVAIARAKRKGKAYAVTPFGVYRVTKSRKKQKKMYAFLEAGQKIRTPKRDLLTRSVNRLALVRNRLFRESMDRILSK